MSDYTAFDIYIGEGFANAPERTKEHRSGSSTLSTPHISPHVEYRTGASILKAHRGGQKEDQVGGGIRGEVKGFSNDSRLRLMRLVAGIKRDAKLPAFVTLTYPNSFPDARSSKKHLDTFFKRFTRAFPGHGSIWKLEPQKRGAPHYHILTWNLDLDQVKEFIPGAWFDIAGAGDIKHLKWHRGEFENQHCVQQVYSYNGVMRYASKYLGKTFEVEGWQSVGRYWGVVGRSNVPLGELIQQEVTRKKAIEIMRYQRRFTGRKGHNKKSQTIFCDADQWVEKNGLLES
jgi:hypothetical protein